MKLKKYIEVVMKAEEITFTQVCRDLSLKCDCNSETIRRVGYGVQKPSALLASYIVRATEGVVRFKDLRPDIYKNLRSEEVKWIRKYL